VQHARQTVLTSAYAIHPERFVRGKPKTIALPDAAWINPPPKPIVEQQEVISTMVILDL